MALSIKDTKADELAHKLAAMMGTTITGAVVEALQEKYDRMAVKLQGRRKSKGARLRQIMEDCARLPVYDTRSADEIMGFNERGVFD